MSQSNVINVTSADFENTVLKSDTPVLVDFWAEWCGPCRVLGPTLESLADDYDGKVRVAKVNVDESPDLASAFGIRSIPTIVAFKNGEPTGITVGAQPKAKLVELVDQQLAS